MGCENSTSSVAPGTGIAVPHLARHRRVYQEIGNNIQTDLPDRGYTENVRPLSRELMGKDLLLIDKTLEKHFLFYKLNKHQRLKLIECMQKFGVSQRQFIFREGDEPTYAFLLCSGAVEIFVQNDRFNRKSLAPGEIFGDLALLNIVNRSASAFASTDCEMWGLSKETFHKKMKELMQATRTLAYRYVCEAPVFSKFTFQQKNAIASNMYEGRYEKEAVIFRKGDAANSLYIVIRGEVQIVVPNRPNVCLKSGEVFGEGCLRKGQIRTGTAQAVSECHCLVISRERLTFCAGAGNISSISFHCILKWALKRSSTFDHQSKSVIDKIINTGEVRHYEDGQVIFQKGQIVAHMIVCLSGEIFQQGEDQEGEMRNSIRRRSGSLGVGIGAIFNDELQQGPPTYGNSLVKRGLGSIFLISHTEIQNILCKNLITIKTIKSTGREKPSLSRQIQPLPNSLELSHLQIVKKYESNQISDIYLVINRLTKRQYVIKCVKKNKVIQNKQQILFQRQKRLLGLLNNQYIVPLIKTFKDNDYLFLLFGYYSHLDLQYLINAVGQSSPQFQRFYAANLILRLEYIHSECVVYRDLKPQNCVIDDKGYLSLIDFGIAKQLKKENGFRTFTILGTPHYMAPQIHQGYGYSFQVDIWSLGILLYSIILGFLPFGDTLDDPYEIFSSIQLHQLSFPPSYESQPGKQFLHRLLTKNSDARIVKDFSCLKNMQFFSGIGHGGWQSLKQGTMQCPVQFDALRGADLKFSQDHRVRISLLSHLQRERRALGLAVKSRRDTYWDKQF